jgi:hypothetical protein
LSTISVIAKEVDARSTPDSPLPKMYVCYENSHSVAAEFRQADRAFRQRRAVRPNAAHRVDRGSRGAAPQFGVATTSPCRRRSRRQSARAIRDFIRAPSAENAVDFAQKRVEVVADWDTEDIAVVISDDGPGFAPEILDRIGEPTCDRASAAA